MRRSYYLCRTKAVPFLLQIETSHMKKGAEASVRWRAVAKTGLIDRHWGGALRWCWEVLMEWHYGIMWVKGEWKISVMSVLHCARRATSRTSGMKCLYALWLLLE